MDPKQQALARREMNQWLADNGINGRTVTLIDAMISIWIGLENPDNERTHPNEAPTVPTPRA